MESKNILFAREHCTDPIDTCSAICEKQLSCGLHFCKLNCHDGMCPPCDELQSVKCRCKKASLKIPCGTTSAETFICNKICQKSNKCRVHRCGVKCCSNDKDHVCQLKCNRHRCKNSCHSSTPCPDCHLSNDNFVIDQDPTEENPVSSYGDPNICFICHKVCKGGRGLEIHQATHRIDTSRNTVFKNNNSSDSINANLQTQMPSLLDPQLNEKFKNHFVNLVKKKTQRKTCWTNLNVTLLVLYASLNVSVYSLTS